VNRGILVIERNVVNVDLPFRQEDFLPKLKPP
jgi:hypothetical protein